MEDIQRQRSDRQDAIISWFAVGLSCAYFVWSYHVLSVYTKVFITLFMAMGVEVPALARPVLAYYPWFYPLLFVGAAVSAVAKEFVITNKRVSLLLTLVISLVVLFIVDWIKHLFTLPLLDLMQKLK